MQRLRQFIERNFYSFLLPVAKLYWFVFRPIRRGAKALVVAEGKVLLIQNTYRWYQLWNLPGGRVRKGEEPEVAVRREVKEEVGLILEHVVKLGEFFTTIDFKRDTVHLYLAKFEKIPVLQIDAVEISKAEWFPLDKLPENLYISVTKALEMYKQAHCIDVAS